MPGNLLCSTPFVLPRVVGGIQPWLTLEVKTPILAVLSVHELTAFSGKVPLNAEGRPSVSITITFSAPGWFKVTSCRWHGTIHPPYSCCCRYPNRGHRLQFQCELGFGIESSPSSGNRDSKRPRSSPCQCCRAHR